MELRSELGKDARQFFREQRTLILLFAVPAIVLLVLGGVFGRTTAEIGGTTIGVCNLDNSTASNLFISGMVNNTRLIDYSSNPNCSLFAQKEVGEGRVAAAIILPAGFQSGIETGVSQNLTVYVDNSRIQTAPSIESFIKAVVQDTGQRIGIQFILGVWGKLDDAALQLNGLSVNLGKGRNESIQMKSDLNKTSTSLKSINFSYVREELNSANSTIIYTLNTLQTAEKNLSEIESSFASYDSELNQTESDLMVINRTIYNASSYLLNTSSVNCSDPLFFTYCLSLNSINSTLGAVKISVEDRIMKVRAARASLADANRTIGYFKSSISGAKTGAADSLGKINKMNFFIDNLENSRDDALSTMKSMDSSLDQIINQSFELDIIISGATKQIKDITSRKPESVISPIIMSPKYLFGKRTFFDFLLPSLLPMILMFVSLFLSSTSLVKEKKNGLLTRVMLSQVHPLEYSAKKVISYTIVLLPEALLLTLVASFVYGSFSVVDFGTILFVFETLTLLIMAFTSIGVVIAAYSESEVTAFLASLVIGLPLLFLSGLLFPFEFMPSIIASIGQASPLTQAVFSMQSVMLYHSPQQIGFGILLIYSIMFTAIAAFSLKKAR